MNTLSLFSDVIVINPFPFQGYLNTCTQRKVLCNEGTIAKFAMQYPIVLMKGRTFQILCLSDASRPEDDLSRSFLPVFYAVPASPQSP